MEELRGIDYITKPIKELVSHPDYSESAMKKMFDVSKMTSTELEELELPKKGE